MKYKQEKETLSCAGNYLDDYDFGFSSRNGDLSGEDSGRSEDLSVSGLFRDLMSGAR